MGLRTILSIAKNTLSQAFKRKSNILTFIILPILGVLIAIVFQSFGNTTTKVGILNLDSSYISQDMVKSIKNNDKFAVYDLKADGVQAAVENKEVDSAIVIPANFGSQIYGGAFKKLDVTSIQGQQVTVWVQNYLNFYVDNLMDISKASNGDKASFDKIYKGYKSQGLKLENLSIQDKTRTKGVTKQSIGFLLIFMLMASSIAANFIIKDKVSRTYFRICTGPVSKAEYVVANVLANLVILLMQIAVIIGFAVGIMRFDFYISLPVLFLILFAFGTTAIGFGIFVASVASTHSQSTQLSNVIIVPTCMLSGCFWPIELMPAKMQILANLFPQTWVLKLVDALQYGKSFSQVYSYLLVILGFSVVLFILAIINMTRDENLRKFI